MKYNAKLFLFILIAVIIGLFLISLKTQKVANQSFDATENIQRSSDLDQAQDQLNVINVDSIDPGLNQLNTEAATF